MKTGLWTKTSKKGVNYATGKIKIEDKEYKILLFKNAEKKNTNSPDFNMTLEKIQLEKKDNEEIYAEFGEITEIDENDLAF